MSYQKTKIQVPINTQVKEKGEERARELGFSSLQEAIRLFVTNLGSGRFDISFEPKTEYISENTLRELAVEYNKYKKEEESGKVKPAASSATELVRQLSE